MPSKIENKIPTQLNKIPLIIVLTPSIRKSVIEGALF